jgi:hypothetical protein
MVAAATMEGSNRIRPGTAENQAVAIPFDGEKAFT